MYLSGEEGAAFTAACTRRAFDDPVIGKAVHDGILATVELAAVGAPGLVGLRHRKLKEQGREASTEIEPGEEEAVQESARQTFALARCLFAKVVEKIPLGKILEDPAPVGSMLGELMEANACAPEQKSPAGS